MKERKTKLRKQIAGEKAKYCGSTLKALSDKVLTQLESHPLFQSAESVLLFHSLKDEVYTHAFVEKWSKQKHILLPVVKGDILQVRQYTGQHDLATGAYGIKEPVGELVTDYTQIDLVVVPGVAFDAEGHRLGRGKGYYDKLLPHINGYKIGICFPFQFVGSIPTEPFDICMDEVLCG